MKIGIFTNAYKPMISGVVNSIELIRRGMIELGHQVYLFAPKFYDYQDDESDVYRFASLNLSSQIKYPLAIPYSPRIINIINRLDLDIVHSHHPFLLGRMGAQVAKKKGIPLVYTFHTQYEQYTHYIPLLPDRLVKRAARYYVKDYTNNVDLIICPSPAILSLIEEYGITAPYRMIPNAIDLRQFQNPDSEPVRKKFGISPDDRVLVYVGRIGKEKNLEFLLNAFARAWKEVPSAKLMIVGEGPEKEPLEQYAKQLGVGERVIFPGRVEYKEIPQYYGVGYAFVITSTTEVKPLAILEAMASSLPVIAVSAAGSSDTVTSGQDGLLTSLDLDEYTSALITALKDPDLQRKLSGGARATSDQYSMDNTAHVLENLYMNLIEEKNAKKENAVKEPVS